MNCPFLLSNFEMQELPMIFANHPKLNENKTTECAENSREHRDCDCCHCEALQSAAEQSEAIPMASWTKSQGLLRMPCGMARKDSLGLINRGVI
jgi:hypothetical protein